MTGILEANGLVPAGRSVRGVQASPTTWELRVIARFNPRPGGNPCGAELDVGNHTRVECTVSYEIDGKAIPGGLVVDATSGEDLTGRALVF